MTRWVSRIGVVAIAMIVSGCSSSTEEIGPASESDVPAVDESEIQKGMEESMRRGGMKDYKLPTGQ